jgi:hypothetical protein
MAADPDWSRRMLCPSPDAAELHRTDVIYLAQDLDLGPDPSPGSAVCRSGFSVNLRRQSFDF